MANFIQQIKRECERWFSKTYNMVLAEDWLVQCIEYLTEEFPDIKINDCREHIYKQLLDFDLMEIGTRCLPQNVFTSDVGTLEGVYLLQINSCIDATHSYFSQIQKLKGDINENVLVNADDPITQTKKFVNRLFTIELTDGTQTIKALEYQTIRCLDNVVPGNKIQLHGKINYRQKVLMLTDANVKVLGGTVEGLSEPESKLNILNMKLEEKCNDKSAKGQAREFPSTGIMKSIGTNQTNYNSNSVNMRNQYNNSFQKQSNFEERKPNVNSMQYTNRYPATNTTNDYNKLENNNKYNKNSFDNGSKFNKNKVLDDTQDAKNLMKELGLDEDDDFSQPNKLNKNDHDNDDDDELDDLLINQLDQLEKFKQINTNQTKNDNFQSSNNNNNNTNRFSNNNNNNNYQNNNRFYEMNSNENKFASSVKRQPSSDMFCQNQQIVNKRPKSNEYSNQNEFNNYNSNSMQQKMQQNQNSSAKSKFSNLENCIDDKDDDFQNAQILNKRPRPSELTVTRNEYNNYNSSSLQSKPQQQQQSFNIKSKLVSPNQIQQLCVDTNDDDDEFLLRNIDKFESISTTASKPKKINLQIERLVDLMHHSTPPPCCSMNDDPQCTHTIYGFVQTLTAPLKQIDMKWYQTCLLSDGTSHLEVFIDDTLMSQLLGLTCQQAKELFKRSKEDPSLKNVYANKCDKCQNKLAHLSCIFHLKYDSNKKKYCVKSLSEIDHDYFDYLLNKIKNFL